tara:strand:- start:9132 stop:13583 length:4452 start_codon:yes stop_codon:yes gene_type:complete
MAIIYSYDQGLPSLQDMLLGTDVDNSNVTKQYSISDIINLANQNIGTGSVTRVGIIGDQFITATGVVTTQGDLTVGLNATGAPSATTFLRGDNRWATIGSSFPAEVSVSLDGETLTSTVQSLNFISGAPNLVTGSAAGNDVTLTVNPSGNTVEIIEGNGITINSPTVDSYEITNSGVTKILPGVNIELSPTDGTGEVTVGVAGILDSQYSAGAGLTLGAPDPTTNIAEFAIDTTGSNNYISVASIPDTPIDNDTIAFDQTSSSNDVKTVTFADIPIDAVTNIKSYVDQQTDDKVSYGTDTYTSINSVKNIVSLTDAQYQTLLNSSPGPDPSTLYLTVTTAPTQFTVTIDPLTTSGITDTTPPSGYSLDSNFDVQGSTRTGAINSTYEFDTRVLLPSGYQFDPSDPYVASLNGVVGTITGDANVTQALSGTIQLIPSSNCTATLVQNNNITGGTINVDYEIVSSPTVSTGPCPHNYTNDFAGATTVNILNSDLEFATAGDPVITDPSGSISGNQDVFVNVQGALTTKQGTATLTIDSTGITGGSLGSAYFINTNNSLTQTGNIGTPYTWTSTVTPATGYGFNDPSDPLTATPAFTQGGSFTSTPANATLTLTGAISLNNACVEYDFTGNSGDSVTYTDCAGGSSTWSFSASGNVTGVCAQTNTPTKVNPGSSTAIITNTQVACTATARTQRTYYTSSSWTSASDATTACVGTTLDTSDTATVYLENASLSSNLNAVFTTPTGNGSPFQGIITDCENAIQTNAQGDQIGQSSTGLSLFSLTTSVGYTSESTACSSGNENAVTGYSSLDVTNSQLIDRAIIYTSATPFNGASIDHYANNFYKTNGSSGGLSVVQVGVSQQTGKIIAVSACANPTTYTITPTGSSNATVQWTDVNGVTQTGTVIPGTSINVCSASAPSVTNGTAGAGGSCTGDSNIIATQTLTNTIVGTGFSITPGNNAQISGLPGSAFNFNNTLSLNSGCTFGPDSSGNQTTFPLNVGGFLAPSSSGGTTMAVNGGTVQGEVTCSTTPEIQTWTGHDVASSYPSSSGTYTTTITGDVGANYSFSGTGVTFISSSSGAIGSTGEVIITYGVNANDSCNNPSQNINLTLSAGANTILSLQQCPGSNSCSINKNQDASPNTTTTTIPNNTAVGGDLGGLTYSIDTARFTITGSSQGTGSVLWGQGTEATVAFTLNSVSSSGQYGNQYFIGSIFTSGLLIAGATSGVTNTSIIQPNGVPSGTYNALTGDVLWDTSNITSAATLAPGTYQTTWEITGGGTTSTSNQRMVLSNTGLPPCFTIQGSGTSITQATSSYQSQWPRVIGSARFNTVADACAATTLNNTYYGGKGSGEYAAAGANVNITTGSYLYSSFSGSNVSGALVPGFYKMQGTSVGSYFEISNPGGSFGNGRVNSFDQSCPQEFSWNLERCDGTPTSETASRLLQDGTEIILGNVVEDTNLDCYEVTSQNNAALGSFTAIAQYNDCDECDLGQ